MLLPIKKKKKQLTKEGLVNGLTRMCRESSGGWWLSSLVPRLIGGSLEMRLVAEWLEHEPQG